MSRMLNEFLRETMKEGGADPLFLMDASAFIYRGYFANQRMQTAAGQPTGALFLLGRLLVKILRQMKPRYFGVILDGPGGSFRNALYEPYKAQRDKTPEGLVSQIEPAKALVRALGLHLIVSKGFEADDCVASLAERFGGERPVVILGADKDLKQCLNERVALWDPSGKEEKLTTLASFRDETGLAPDAWPDFQAVIGDSSDNIPGAPGIGPKTAQKIFQDFPTLESIRDNRASLPERIRGKIEPVLADLFLFRDLTRLDKKVCEHVPLADLAVRQPDRAVLEELLGRYELRTLLRDAMSLVSDRQSAPAQQGTLFAADGSSAPDPSAASSPPHPEPEEGEEVPDEAPAFGGAFVLELPSLPAPLAISAADLRPEMFAGQETAVIRQDGIWHAAVPGACWRLEPEDEAPLVGRLLSCVAGASRIVVAGVKEMLARQAEWGPYCPAPPPVSRFFDLSIGAYLLNPEERDYSWGHLTRGLVSPGGAPLETPASAALILAGTMRVRLAEAGLLALMEGLEIPLAPVLAAMEERGVAIDLPEFEAFLAKVRRELGELEKKAYAEAGGPFNIRSARQIGELLFTRLRLPGSGRTQGGAPSTSQEALERLKARHPVVDTILEYRKLEKLRSTYLEPFPRLVDAHGRIHTRFNQLATATGRLSSSDPNLQNIPARGELGRHMRSCFTAGPGRLLVSADYSQIELRILAHLSQDEALASAFRAGTDIHAATAARLFDREPQTVSREERAHAKTINFGLIYGMGPQKLARDLKMSLGEAKAFIARYFETFATLKRFYEGILERARETGYVATMAGRRRLLPDIHSRSHAARARAERQAVNAVVQGSAADIIKIAMIDVARDAGIREMGGALVLQVHDELVLEAPAENAEAVGGRLASLMEKAAPAQAPLSIPLVVEWGAGPNWGSAH